MDLALPSLPIPVALAAVAVIGYLIGRWQRSEAPTSSDATRHELKRAQAVVVDLERIAHRVRRELGHVFADLTAQREGTQNSSRTAGRRGSQRNRSLFKPGLPQVSRTAHKP